MEMMGAPDTSRPVACNLAAFDDEQGNALRADMKVALIRSEAVPDGYCFHYPGTAAWVLRLAEFITLERICCPFFTFALEGVMNSGRTLRHGQEGLSLRQQ